MVWGLGFRFRGVGLKAWGFRVNPHSPKASSWSSKSGEVLPSSGKD